MRVEILSLWSIETNGMQWVWMQTDVFHENANEIVCITPTSGGGFRRTKSVTADIF